MDGQSSLKVLVLAGVLTLGLSACACKLPKADKQAELHPTPESPASTRPMSSGSRKAGFGAAGEFVK